MPLQPNGLGPGEDPGGLMSALVSHEAPFTWAAGDTINVSGTYQMLG